MEDQSSVAAAVPPWGRDSAAAQVLKRGRTVWLYAGARGRSSSGAVGKFWKACLTAIARAGSCCGRADLVTLRKTNDRRRPQQRKQN
jgi:hypothetical protein